MSLPTITAAAAYYGLTLEHMLGPSRKPRPIQARAAVVYVMRQRDGASYPMIASRLARADHTTIISNMKRAEMWMQYDPIFSAFVTAQMALPRFSPVAAPLESPFPSAFVPPQPKRWPKALPPCPARLVKMKPQPKPVREIITAAGRRFSLDENGFGRDDNFSHQALVRASDGLIAALRREHPERCIA